MGILSLVLYYLGLAEQHGLKTASDCEGDVYRILADSLNVGGTNIECEDFYLSALSELPRILCTLENKRLSDPSFTQRHVRYILINEIFIICSQLRVTDK